MRSDAGDEGLSWEGDDDDRIVRPSRPAPANPAARDRASRAADETAPSQLGTGVLVALGVFGGVYALYVVGWIIGGLNLRGWPTLLLGLPDAFVTPWIVIAALGTALWLPAVWWLTKGRPSWVRVALLVVGAVLLVPWPFVTPVQVAL